MGYHLLTVPVGRNVYLSTVRAHMIVLDWHGRRLLIEMSAPGKAYVHILRLTIAVEFPDARNRNRAPMRVIEVGKIEICWALVGILHPLELPYSVKRKEILTHRLVYTGKIAALYHSAFLIHHVVKGIGEEGCVKRQTVDFVHLQVVPLGESGLLNGCLVHFPGCCLRLLGSVRVHGQSCQTQSKE